MKEILVPIDQAGRIVLPKGVREELAIKSGDKLKLSVTGSSVTLTPTTGKPGFVRKGKSLVFMTGGEEKLTNEMVENILAETRAEREDSIIAGFNKKKRPE